MSRFYDAMVRSEENTTKPPLTRVDEEEHYHEPSEVTLETGTDEVLEPDESPGQLGDTVPHDIRFNTAKFEARESRWSTGEKTDHEYDMEPLHPAYERIIQKLLTSRRSPRQGVILVSSAVAGEGTSTVARNTALALGRSQLEHVVLVDANIRAPSQHAAFETEISDGLSEVFRGSISLTSAVKPEVAPGLSLLTSGMLIASPPHLFTMSAVQGVVMALTSLFDWVIIDGPPLTTSPEAASIAAASGGAMLVIQAEQTRREVVGEAHKVLEESDVEVLGAVLNRRKYHIPDFVYKRL
jgi:capsular exopolysaccharide synthesis family protein